MGAAGAVHRLQPADSWQEGQSKDNRRDAKLPPKDLALSNLEGEKANKKGRQNDSEQQLKLDDACGREAEEGGYPVCFVVP